MVPENKSFRFFFTGSLVKNIIEFIRDDFQMRTNNNNAVNSAILGIYKLLIISSTLFALYFAQNVVILFALAAFLTFLLSPLVTRLAKFVGEALAILIVVIIVFTFIGFSVYVFSRELYLFGSNSEYYNENIQSKLKAFEFQKENLYNYFKENFSDVYLTPKAENSTNLPPLELKIIDLSGGLIQFVQSLFGSFLNIVASLGIILLLVIFMLFNRGDIRSRIIKFMGHGKVGSTISALDDISTKMYDFFFRQTMVNISYGMIVSIGLYFIGVPNYILWGYFAAIFQYIPYVGPFIGATLPIAFSFIIADTWVLPVLTISYFVFIATVTANFIEPMFYSIAAGISSFAFVSSFVFWTWFFGPIGLLLSTPLTVCLVVLSKHSSMLKFISDLFREEHVSNPEEEYYNQLLKYDSNESVDLIGDYLKTNSLISLFDSILIPVIAKAENDLYLDVITIEKKESVFQGIYDILEFLKATNRNESQDPDLKLKKRVYCIPAKAARDKLGSNILTQFLIAESYDVEQAKSLNLENNLEFIENEKIEVVCIVIVAPFVLSYAEQLCKRLRQQKPNLKIIVCMLGWPKNKSVSDKFGLPEADSVAYSILEVIESLSKI